MSQGLIQSARSKPFIAALALIVGAWGSLIARPPLVAQAAPPTVVIAYPGFSTDTASPNYTVTVNGTAVYVHAHFSPPSTPGGSNGFAYAHFAFAGTANVAVHVSQPVSTYTLSPTRYGIASARSGNDVTFSLTEPRKLLLWKVNSLNESLIIIADPLEDSVPRLTDPSVVQLTGADPTGVNDSAPVINSAITGLATNGTLYVPAGSYLIRDSVRPKSNMTLYLAPGAEIVQAQQAGIATNMVDIRNADNVTVKGRGRLNGNGLYNRYHTFGWYAMFLLHNANNVTFTDITTFNPGGAGGVWQEYGTNVRVENFKVISNIGIENTDGFDFLDCTNCGVNNSFVKATDDFGNFATDNVLPPGLVDNVQWTNLVDFNNGTGGGFAGGSTTRTNVSNVLWENADVISAPQAFRTLALYAGTDSNYRVNNLHVEQLVRDLYSSTNAGIGLKVKVPYWDPAWVPPVGNINGVTFSNVVLGTAATGLNELVSHCPGYAVSNVAFNGVKIGGTLLTGIQHADTSNPDPNWKTIDYATGGNCGVDPNQPPTGSGGANPAKDWTDWNTITFTNNAATLVNVVATAPNAVESTLTPGTLTFTRSSSLGGAVDTTQALTVNYSTIGNAAAGTSYIALPGTVTIPVGATSATANVVPTGTAIPDAVHQVRVMLKPGTGYQMDANYHATVNIYNSLTGNTVTVTNPGPQTGTVGTAVSLQIQATDSASGQTLTYSATGLPAGLSINSSTGLISGTPTTAGTSTTTVTARDTTGASGSATFSWTINPASGGGITNGGFETGNLNGWTVAAGTAAAVAVPHTGSYSAQVGSTTGPTGTSSITQTFTVPGGNTTLGFWWRAGLSSGCQLTNGGTSATLRDNTTSTNYTMLAQTCIADAAWRQVTQAVTAGHSYTLTLRSLDDGTDLDFQTSLFDDVTLS